MNEDVFEGKWKQLKGEAQEEWGRLTGDDIDRVEGNFNKLVGQLQEKYGYSREKAEEQIENFMEDRGD